MKKKQLQVQVVLPGRDDDAISNSLRRLTKAVHKAGLSKAAVCGFFGGEYGYGTDFENDVFEMHWDRQHPECTCGGSQPKHRESCAMSRGRIGEWISARIDHAQAAAPEGLGGWNEWSDIEKGMRAFEETHPYPQCSCGEESAWLLRNNLAEVPDQDCGSPTDYEHTSPCDWFVIHRPTFLHKPSGSTVKWYKYIGRDMKCDLKAEWHVIARECLNSIRRRDSSAGTA